MQPLLDIRHLEMLAAVADSGSVVAAAERLGVTASALSHRIREAERRLDVILFRRLGKRLQPTPAGEVLRRAAERVLSELARAEADAREIAAGAREVVRIGIGAYSSYHWLPGFLAALRQVHPGIQIEVVADAIRHPVTALLEGGIDLAVTSIRPTRPGIAVIPLFEDELVAIMSPSHRFAGRTYLEAEDFATEPYITYSHTPEPGHEYDRLFSRAAPIPRRITRVEFVEAIVELVKAQFGLSILTRWAMEPHVRAGTLACVRVTPEGLPVPWSVALREAEYPDGPAADVARALVDWCVSSEGGFRSLSPVPAIA